MLACGADGVWAWSASGRLHATARVDDGDGGTIALRLVFDDAVNIGTLRTARLATSLGSGIGG